VVLLVAIAGLVGMPGRQSDKVGESGLSLRITSPLGRTGLAATVHIVAQIAIPTGVALSPVQFYVDGKPVGSVDDGPPYAVTWTDGNPFEPREIRVQATASTGAVLSDRIVLPAYEVAERTQVTGVLLETSVYDRTGRFAASFDPSTFSVLENKVPQK